MRRLSGHSFYRTPTVDESDRLSWCRRQLVEAAQLIAVGPDSHAAALPDFVHAPDELRLVWDDAFILAPQVHDAGLITDEAFRLATALDERINAAPVAPDYEEAMAAIASSPEWVVVREQARVLVEALGAEVEPPDLRTGYVQ